MGIATFGRRGSSVTRPDPIDVWAPALACLAASQTTTGILVTISKPDKTRDAPRHAGFKDGASDAIIGEQFVFAISTGQDRVNEGGVYAFLGATRIRLASLA